MSWGSVLSQQSLTPRYQLITNNTDTLISLTLTREQASSHLKYINNLESVKKLYDVSKEEIILLNKDISILEQRIINANEQIRLKDESLNAVLNIQKEIEKEYKLQIKQSYKSGLSTGIIGGGIGVIIICLLMK